MFSMVRAEVKQMHAHVTVEKPLCLSKHSAAEQGDAYCVVAGITRVGDMDMQRCQLGADALIGSNASCQQDFLTAGLPPGRADHFLQAFCNIVEYRKRDFWPRGFAFADRPLRSGFRTGEGDMQILYRAAKPEGSACCFLCQFFQMWSGREGQAKRNANTVDKLAGGQICIADDLYLVSGWLWNDVQQFSRSAGKMQGQKRLLPVGGKRIKGCSKMPFLMTGKVTRDAQRTGDAFRYA